MTLSIMELNTECFLYYVSFLLIVVLLRVINKAFGLSVTMLTVFMLTVNAEGRNIACH
jgi:hypothetical protein